MPAEANNYFERSSHYPMFDIPKLMVFRVAEDCGTELLFKTNRQPLVVIGRDKTCDIVLNARGVSRKHCHLNCKAGKWYVADLESTNGTILESKSTPPTTLLGNEHLLHSHDEMVVGEVVIKIELADRGPDATEVLIGGCAGEVTEVFRLPQEACRETNGEENPMRASRTYLRPKPEGRTAGQASPVTVNEQAQEHIRLSKRIPPFSFRGYSITKKIGQGGMGDVFLAADASAAGVRELAVKFLRQQAANAQDKSRFLREMEIAIKLRHPSIIECIDCGHESGELFIVMPYCAGGNLSELLKRSGAITVQRTLRLMDRILAGMQVAHQQGIVHRDLKPQNILLSKDASGKFHPLISDFGLAKSYLLAGDSGMTVNGTVGGSWAYMPKEQLTNFRFVTPQSDVWSLGAIFYECLALRPPRLLPPGCDPIRAVLSGNVDPIEELLPNLPHRLCRFIMKAVAIETSDRFKDAKQMRAALRNVAQLEGVPL